MIPPSASAEFISPFTLFSDDTEELKNDINYPMPKIDPIIFPKITKTEFNNQQTKLLMPLTTGINYSRKFGSFEVLVISSDTTSMAASATATIQNESDDSDSEYDPKTPIINFKLRHYDKKENYLLIFSQRKQQPGI